MRTTLTLDDDVAAMLERVRVERKISFKEAVNDALRRGLQPAKTGRRDRRRFETTTVDLGTCLLPNLDCTSEVLAFAEGEDYR